MAFVLSSPAFPPGGEIPAAYTCVGRDVSPPLQWSGAPPGTRSFVLAVVDPDAPSGLFHHWAVYDIPAGRHGLPGGERAGTARGVAGHRPPEAINDFGRRGYGGPCPPPGRGVHRYAFELLALDTPTLAISARARVPDVIAAARPYVVAKADLVGTFRR